MYSAERQWPSFKRPLFEGFKAQKHILGSRCLGNLGISTHPHFSLISLRMCRVHVCCYTVFRRPQTTCSKPEEGPNSDQNSWVIWCISTTRITPNDGLGRYFLQNPLIFSGFLQWNFWGWQAACPNMPSFSFRSYPTMAFGGQFCVPWKPSWLQIVYPPFEDLFPTENWDFPMSC